MYTNRVNDREKDVEEDSPVRHGRTSESSISTESDEEEEALLSDISVRDDEDESRARRSDDDNDEETASSEISQDDMNGGDDDSSWAPSLYESSDEESARSDCSQEDDSEEEYLAPPPVAHRARRTVETTIVVENVETTVTLHVGQSVFVEGNIFQQATILRFLPGNEPLRAKVRLNSYPSWENVIVECSKLEPVIKRDKLRPLLAESGE